MLTNKERNYLRKMANNEESILQIGKASASPELVIAVNEALEKRELIKVTVLNNCMDSIFDVANIVSERTHSEIVQIIGKKIVLYRESKEKIYDLKKFKKN
ncbi:MAG: YhbY family RNA-binding protein [Lachnospirales bacterium]